MTVTTAPRPLPLTNAPRDVAAYAAGLRHLADLIESGVAPMPTNPSMGFHAYRVATEGVDQPTAARNLMRALGGGRYAKDQWDTSLILRGMCGGVPVDIWVARDEVCERVVVGTEVVEIPAQPAVEATTFEKEIVEWRCGSILDAAAETADTIEVSA